MSTPHACVEATALAAGQVQSLVQAIAALTHRCLHRLCPAYLMDIVTFIDSGTAVYGVSGRRQHEPL